MTSPASGLAALERQVARELDLLAYPAAPWVKPATAPDGTAVLDCAVIGAGQYGLALGGLLRRERVERFALFDAAPAGSEGPWVTFARMAMLRTPKHLSGPELGIPSLSFRAFWEAQHGAAGWEAMYRPPRTGWMDYLNWFRRVLDLPVANGWRLTALTPAAEGRLLRLDFATPQGAAVRHARSVILATGAAGGGGYALSAVLRQGLPPGRALHANDAIDPARFAGLRLGVLGAGAAAFDVAITALQAAAASAEVACRRPALPRDNPRRWMENAGLLGHYVDLPDAVKWAYARHLRGIGQPPPQPTFDAAMALPGFRLATGMPWDRVSWTGNEILVEGGGQRRAYDLVVDASGFLSDLALRPECAALAPLVARWADRFAPPPGQEEPRLARQPYLDRLGAFTEREPGSAPWVARVLTITGNANLSLGPVASSISAMKYVAPRLVEGVKRQLLLDQQAEDWAEFLHNDHAELRPFTLPESAAA